VPLPFAEKWDTHKNADAFRSFVVIGPVQCLFPLFQQAVKCMCRLHKGHVHMEQNEADGTSRARLYRYFDGYRSETFHCPSCSWAGGFEQLEQEQYRDLFDGSCPQCEKMLMIVSYPTAEEIRKAAADGNEKAQQMLPAAKQREDLDAAFDSDGLKNADQLPDLPGNELEFQWDQEQDGEKNLTIIRSGEIVIWIEPAFYEGWPRFNQIKEILKARYGNRFKSLKPTERSELYLYGDDLKSPGKISFF
jgi:hypothetical protein